MTFEDQMFITLMKLRQNYTNLHLANLFSCSVGTISNIVTTFIHVLHAILFKDIMRESPPDIRIHCVLPHLLLSLQAAEL